MDSILISPLALTRSVFPFWSRILSRIYIAFSCHVFSNSGTICQLFPFLDSCECTDFHSAGRPSSRAPLMFAHDQTQAMHSWQEHMRWCCAALCFPKTWLILLLITVTMIPQCLALCSFTTYLQGRTWVTTHFSVTCPLVTLSSWITGVSDVSFRARAFKDQNLA